MGRFGSVAEKIRFKVNFEQGERRVPGRRRGLSTKSLYRSRAGIHFYGTEMRFGLVLD